MTHSPRIWFQRRSDIGGRLGPGLGVAILRHLDLARLGPDVVVDRPAVADWVVLDDERVHRPVPGALGHHRASSLAAGPAAAKGPTVSESGVDVMRRHASSAAVGTR